MAFVNRETFRNSAGGHNSHYGASHYGLHHAGAHRVPYYVGAQYSGIPLYYDGPHQPCLAIVEEGIIQNGEMIDGQCVAQ